MPFHGEVGPYDTTASLRKVLCHNWSPHYLAFRGLVLHGRIIFAGINVVVYPHDTTPPLHRKAWQHHLRTYQESASSKQSHRMHPERESLAALVDQF